MQKEQYLVFISHIREEAGLARILREYLASLRFLKNGNVFASIDVIKAGDRWFSEIEKALETVKITLVLCSKASVGRPWINFEVGASSIRKIRIVPVCHSGFRYADLPAPFNMHQAKQLYIEADGEESSDLPEIVESVANSVGATISESELKRSELFGEVLKRIKNFEQTHQTENGSVEPQTIGDPLKRTELKPTISIAKSGLALLAADMCGSIQLKTSIQDKLLSAKVIQLHNAIVKAQVERKGKILKEWGGEVIAFFDDIDSCLQAARQIQEAFSLHNLLFSAHKLRTKLAIAQFRNNHSESSSLFSTTSSARSPDGKKSVQVYDLLGSDIDRLSRILEIAKPNEILFSAEILNYLNGKYKDQGKREKEFAELRDDDPARQNFLHGIGHISLGKLKWSCFPKRPDLTIDMGFPEEAVVAFRFDHIADCLGEKEERLLKNRRSGLRLAGIKNIRSDSDDFTDMLLIGQSLIGWGPLLNHYDYLESLKKNHVRLGLIAMSGDLAVKSLRATTPEAEKPVQDIEKCMKFFDDTQRKPESKGVIDLRYAPILVADAWSFYSNKASDLLSNGRELTLPYEQIIDTYATPDTDTGQVMEAIEKIKKEYEGNLSIEWCIHDVLLGVNPDESLSTLLSLDWFYALARSVASRYLLARIKAQHMFSHLRDLDKAFGSSRD